MQILGIVDEQGDGFLGAPEQFLKVAFTPLALAGDRHRLDSMIQRLPCGSVESVGALRRSPRTRERARDERVRLRPLVGYRTFAPGLCPAYVGLPLTPWCVRTSGLERVEGIEPS
jgi:hypothetical protein